MRRTPFYNFFIVALLVTMTASVSAQQVDSKLPWSVRLTESEMIRYPESWQLDFQPKLKWDYCHGLELGAMLDVYDAYGDKKIRDYAIAYADTMVHEDGSITAYKLTDYSLDRINSGKILFRIYEQTKNPKYKKALDLLYSQFEGQPRNEDGGFWHKKIYPHQMWLDGIYMGAPFYAEYAFRNNLPQDYADDFFDYNDYGMGEDKSGILFLITMSERKWCISTHGEAIQIFTDAGQEYMTDNFGSYLSDGEYYEGFMKFADLCEEFIIQAQSGEPYDVENLPEETIPFYMIFLISLVVGFVIALIVTGVMRSRMKTVHMKPDAADYMKDGSLHINRSRDIFLYHQVTRTAKPKEESSGGGGSSTHTSSSGETHGGSSGSF